MEETAYMIEYREHPGSYFPPPILTDLLSHSMEPWRDTSGSIICQCSKQTVLVILRFNVYCCLCNDLVLIDGSITLISISTVKRMIRLSYSWRCGHKKKTGYITNIQWLTSWWWYWIAWRTSSTSGGEWGARGRCTVGSVGGGGSLTARGFKSGASIVAEPKVVDL